jgi:hypothetical protein
MMHRLSTHVAGRLQPPRHGVTLLEVLFSIGVVMIGLIGIAVLIPAGGVLARRGVIADAAAHMSSNATREFSLRGMAIPTQWRWFNTNAAPPAWAAPVVTGTNFPQPGASFCLDPRFIAEAELAAEMAVRNKFPVNAAYDAGVLWMPRITLQSSVANPLGPVLTQAAANEIFVTADELVFDLPRDRTLGPVQNFVSLPGSVDPQKRSTEGTMSWMATLVPKLDRIGNATSPTGVNPTQEYTLSIVVFDRRLIPDATELAAENLVSERVVIAQQFYSGSPAFSGGDVTLASRASRGVDGADDLELRSGDWVLFSRLKTVMGGVTMQVHKWYRVVSVDEEPIPNGNLFLRDVRVVGPDWDYDATGNFPTQVTIPRGVVDVHEKTIRLETTSLWTY